MKKVWQVTKKIIIEKKKFHFNLGERQILFLPRAEELSVVFGSQNFDIDLYIYNCH